MTKEMKKTPVMGIYFPSDFATIRGELLINFSIDIGKLIESNIDIIQPGLTVAEQKKVKTLMTALNKGGRHYVKGFIKKNEVADMNGSIYSAFNNTYLK